MSFPGRVMIEAPYAKLPPGLPLMVPPPRLGGVLSSMFAGDSVPIDVKDALARHIAVLGEADFLSGSLESHIDKILDSLFDRSEMASQQTRLRFVLGRTVAIKIYVWDMRE